MIIWGRIWPVPLSLVMLDQSNLPPEWSSCTIWRVSSNVNHFSFQNIRMIGMPFKTWLLDLKFENDKWPVLDIELLWIVSLFNQDLANTCQIHQNTPITCHRKFQPDECIWKSTLRCLLIDISLMSLSRGGVLTLPLQFLHSLSPHVPSSPNTKPSPLQGRWRWTLNPGSSERSSVSGPRPTPDRRHMTWETQWSTQHTHTVKLQNVFTPTFVFQIDQNHHLLARKRSVFGLLAFEL